tara:strand:- start:5096 stop:5530 length:435 start_codon:yes stop_codon:yes gene_type:complete
MTVYGGTQKISMGRDKDTDYASKLAAAKAQSGANSYVQGVQSVMNDGAGVAVSNTRTKYGNANLMPNQVLQGETSNFQQVDSPGNRPTEDLPNQTGSVDTEVSSTNVPQQDPEVMETNALERRLSLMAKGGQGFPGLNDRNREV